MNKLINIWIWILTALGIRKNLATVPLHETPKEEMPWIDTRNKRKARHSLRIQRRGFDIISFLTSAQYRHYLEQMKYRADNWGHLRA